MKVLFVGGGRRISLAKRFISRGAEIYSYELDINSPIASVATVIPGLSWNANDINTDLINIITKYKFDIVLPLQDEAIGILAYIKSSYDIESIVSSSILGSLTCYNKLCFEQHFKKINYDMHYPFPNDTKNIIKPIFGFGSRGIRICDGKLEFDENNFVCQGFIDGYEISVDSYFNKESEIIGCIPRSRINVLGGEVSKSKTLVRDYLYYTLLEFMRKIGKDLLFIGPICSQFIINNGNVYVIEINARFGGGAILSMQAGLLMENYIIDEYVNNQQVQFCDYWTENLVMSRFFDEYFYKEHI